MPPIALFVGTFVLWIAAKGRFPDYYAFATVKASPPSSGSPSVPTTPGSAPSLQAPGALPSGDPLYGPGLGRDVQLNRLWQNIAGAAQTGGSLK